jgi:threonine dehydratase
MIDVLQARRVIGAYIDPTPLRRYPTLDELVSARVYLIGLW